MGAILCSREYKKLLMSISIHFNCSVMQLKQQTSGHNNIPFLGVRYIYIYIHIYNGVANMSI